MAHLICVHITLAITRCISSPKTPTKPIPGCGTNYIPFTLDKEFPARVINITDVTGNYEIELTETLSLSKAFKT